MIRNTDLSPPVKLLAIATLAGLGLGLLLGALTGGALNTAASIDRGEHWSARELPFEALMQTVLASDDWSRGAETVLLEADPEEIDSGENARPGVFKHLKLVAILREPSLEAVLRPEKMPDSMLELMVSSTNESGMYKVRLHEQVAQGWEVSGISDTYLQITGTTSGEIVEYRLFEWN